MRPLRALLTDRRGNTAIEFAIVAPVMCTLIMGLGDLMYQGYVQAILEGAIQKAGRDSAIQGGADNAPVIDGKVTAAIKGVAKNATLVMTRRNYASFGRAKPEPFTDGNGNGVRDPKECFDDINNNGVWDADPGLEGQGGASDVTKYTVTVTYPRLFPVWGLIGWPVTNTVQQSTLLKNQPYASQQTVATPPAVCT